MVVATPSNLDKIGVIRQTVNTWLSDIRARQKASRNTIIIRLSWNAAEHENRIPNSPSHFPRQIKIVEYLKQPIGVPSGSGICRCSYWEINVRKITARRL